MNRILAALLLLFCSLPSSAADDKMLYLEFQLISARVPQDSFEGQPRKLWRIGSRYLRLEDVPNPKTKIHGLIIVDEPNIWVIDRATNQGQLSLDPGPNFAIHFPVFPLEESEALKSLDMGNEVRFFHEHGARELPQQEINGIKCRTYLLSMDEREVTLHVKPDGQPLQVSLRSPQYEFSIRYLRFDPNLKPDLGLFRVPAGVQIQK